ncbi:hypothetical protein F0562_025903 [Nyssa sinensis]|uniref:Retrotransposon gag domain-containing protein n=1 Tax=Nyssa sinensis TaxID=561372 RepID=A0A5J5BDB9_9ASTE|nr:hypothetical protein F0562_025903 [Nyssa sinensis]
MEDQCIIHLEARVSSLALGQEKLLKEMQEMIMAMRFRFDQLELTCAHKQGESSINWNGSGKPNGQTSSTNSAIPKLAKLDFFRYNRGEDPMSWICRVEQFFKFQHTSVDEQVPLAIYHLEGEAQMWYQLFKKEEGLMTWGMLKEGCWLEEIVGTEVSNPNCEMNEEGSEDTPEISLHAISGTRESQTMRVRGRARCQAITVLVGSGSTYNFLSKKIAKKIELQPREDRLFEVIVANGEKLTSAGKCKGIRGSKEFQFPWTFISCPKKAVMWFGALIGYRPWD